MKILTQNVRSFNNNASKRRKKSDKLLMIELLLKEEKPDIAILCETKHINSETNVNLIKFLLYFYDISVIFSDELCAIAEKPSSSQH